MDEFTLTQVRAANPVPDVSYLEADGDRLLAEVQRRLRSTPREHVLALRRRPVVIAVCAVVIGLVIPALALSGVIGDLFSFSAGGARLTTPLSETSASALQRMSGTAQSVQLIATRDGEAFYTARTAGGALCVGVGGADQAVPSFTQMQCGTSGPNSFPSSDVPVILASPIYGQAGSSDVYLKQLFGFAADGVVRVVVRGPSGVVADVQPSDDIFATDVPHQPVTELEAYDSTGSVVWSIPLKAVSG